MNRIRLGWGGWLMLAALAAQAEPATPTLTPVVVHGARVNLRAKPAADAEPVGKVAEGSVLQAKSLREDWVEVVPPETVELWVHRDFVKDQTVTAEKLYIRTGRSINHSVVGTMVRGEKLAVRGEFQDWLKIAPSPAASLWVSRKLVEVQSSAPVPTADMGTPKPMPAPIAMVTTETNAMSTATTNVTSAVARYVPADLNLVPLEGQGKSVSMEGVLRVVGFGFRHPSRYRLVRLNGRNVETLCYIRGNSEQLNSLLDQFLRIQGRQYWVNGVDYPVIIPDRISPRATP
ncbi:MAG: SH3 domain-containing protein [Verrucomicrobia bacterium]|nr:MAG: SH3 domain-containing protein [Verrucomicrobiota bacterium]